MPKGNAFVPNNQVKDMYTTIMQLVIIIITIKVKYRVHEHVIKFDYSSVPR